jgi:hypothetical protein
MIEACSKVLSLYLLGGKKKTTKTLIQYSRSAGGGLDQWRIPNMGMYRIWFLAPKTGYHEAVLKYLVSITATQDGQLD